jgi:hypothetical protein
MSKMRSFRLLALVFVVALLVAAPSAFASTTPESVIDADSISQAPSKVCHPKKPVTCRAVELVNAEPSLNAEPASIETEATSVAIPLSFQGNSNFLQEATRSRVQFQTAMICMPPKWYCRTNTLN